MTGGYPTNWGRVFRLVRAPQLWGSWRAKLLAFVAWLLIAMPSFGVLAARHSSDSPPMAGMQFIVMLIYFFYAFTSVLNGGWRRLPVTDRERRAAVWVNIWLLPVLCCLAAWLGAAALAWAIRRTIDLRPAVALFGVQALVIGLFALAVLLLGTWPRTLGWFQMVSRRRAGDWILWLLFSVIVLFSVAWRPDPAWLARSGWWLASGAIALGAMTLPVAQRWARIDARQEDDGRTRSFLPQLRVGGWTGHFLAQIARAMLLAIVMVASFGAMLLVERGTGSAGLTKTFAGTGAAIFGAPVMAAFVATTALQALLRSRRTLLTLPRGGLLLVVTPAVQFLSVLAIMALFNWRTLSGTASALPLAALASFGALAFTYLAFAINLRATQYWELLASGLLLAIPIGAIGALAALAGKSGMSAHVPFAAVAAVIGLVLAASLRWAIWSLRRSRRPYRPWPVNTARWHAS